MSSDQKPVIVLGRFPREEDRRDGYYQRMSAIDDVLAEIGPRIYLRTDGGFKQVTSAKSLIKEGVEEIRICRRWPWQVGEAKRLVAGARCVYLHSILAAEQPVAQDILESADRLVLDLHGVVPEEAEMMGEHERLPGLNLLEKRLVERADVLIGVTQKLLDSVAEKWQSCTGCEKIVIPIIPHFLKGYKSDIKKEPDLVVYAGGVQKWQQIEKMAALAESHFELKFSFFVPDVPRFRGAFGGCLVGSEEEKGGVWGRLTIDSVGPEQLLKHYEKAAYGLLLREDHIVNRVASPTKLTEYLATGVVPIVDSRAIGDFEELGYGTVHWEDPLPDEKVRAAIADQNREVFGRLVERYEKGVGRLTDVLATWG